MIFLQHLNENRAVKYFLTHKEDSSCARGGSPGELSEELVT